MGTDEGSVRDFMPDIRETLTRLVSNLPAGGDTLVLTAFWQANGKQQMVKIELMTVCFQLFGLYNEKNCISRELEIFLRFSFFHRVSVNVNLELSYINGVTFHRKTYWDLN